MMDVSVAESNNWLTLLFKLEGHTVVVAGSDLVVTGAVADMVRPLLVRAADGEVVEKPEWTGLLEAFHYRAVDCAARSREVVSLERQVRDRTEQVRSMVREFSDHTGTERRVLNEFLVEHGLRKYPSLISGHVTLVFESMTVEVDSLEFDGDLDDEDAIREALVVEAIERMDRYEVEVDEGISEVEDWEESDE